MLPALAEKRVALVIGNSAYRFAPELANPANDASDMAGVLQRFGFNVIPGRDLDRDGLYKILEEFEKGLSGADVGLVFYAGHGLQYLGQNYLIPTDAKVETPQALRSELVSLELVQEAMERTTPMSILFLDACRDNPFGRSLARTLGRSAGVQRGLAQANAAAGTLISFSTQPGNIADDGWGRRNSPFTEALVRQLSSSKEDISRVLIAVRNDVRAATKKRQVPWEHSALLRPFYFKESRVTGELPKQSERPANLTPAPKASKTCDDPGFAEAEGKDTSDAFLAYLPKASKQCAAAARRAVRDLREWEAIEAASGRQSGTSRSGSKSSKRPGSGKTRDERALRDLILQYQKEFEPNPRRGPQAVALLADVDLTIKKAACQVYVKDAVAIAQENVEEVCRERGEDWDVSSDIQLSLCMERGPGVLAENLKERRNKISRCKRNKTDESDWQKAQTLVTGTLARGGAGKASDKYIAELNAYIKKHEPDGLHLGQARIDLAAAEKTRLEQACQKFSGDALELAQTNKTWPCGFEGAAWVLDKEQHYAWCMTRPEAERASEAKARRERVEGCTWPRRNDEAWKEASAEGSIESVAEYIGQWRTGPHIEVARSLVNQLCAPKWSDAKIGKDWTGLKLFADEGCKLTPHQVEAERLLDSLDERLWRTAKAENGSKASFREYLRATGENRKPECSGELGVVKRLRGVKRVAVCSRSTGKHSEKAESEIADFDAWAEVNKRTATCSDVAGYLRDREDGRFKSAAKAKLRDLIKRSEKAMKDGQRSYEKKVRRKQTGEIQTGSSVFDEPGPLILDNCSQYEDLLKDSSDPTGFEPLKPRG